MVDIMEYMMYDANIHCLQHTNQKRAGQKQDILLLNVEAKGFPFGLR